MSQGILRLSLALAFATLMVGCATDPTKKVSSKELATYKQWACSKCSTLKNKTSHRACTMVCKKDGTY